MNRIEKVVYNQIKKYPFLKSFVRDVYQFLVFVMKPPKIKLQTELSHVVKEGFFFGFHDKIPWSFDNTKILCHKINDEQPDSDSEQLEVGFFDEDMNHFKVLGTTKSWNWQQGSMLQWRTNHEVIFNFWNGNSHVAKLVDLNGNVIKQLDYPISSISECGNYALSFSFDRLGIGMPGYGYKNMGKYHFNDDMEPTETGIYLFDFSQSEFKLLFSVKHIAQLQRDESMNGAFHYLTHTQFSKDSRNFFFLHRWQEGKSKRVNTRLLTYNMETGRLFVYNTNNMVSHLTWLGDNRILAYASTNLYGDAYTIFELNSDEIEVLSTEKYSSDGHPQFCQNNNLIVCDTYPNRSRIQELFLISAKTNEKTQLGQFFSPFKYRETSRCDLHPRWDRKGEKVCVDSVHTGKRAIVVLSLNSEK